jgi:hypothetical protein
MSSPLPLVLRAVVITRISIKMHACTLEGTHGGEHSYGVQYPYIERSSSLCRLLGVWSVCLISGEPLSCVVPARLSQSPSLLFMTGLSPQRLIL